MMCYRGYIAKIDFDEDEQTLHIEVVNLKDVITFEETCVEDLRKAFIDSMEDCLQFSKECGEKPEKIFSGNFIVRINPDLH